MLGTLFACAPECTPDDVMHNTSVSFQTEVFVGWVIEDPTVHKYIK